VRPDWEARRAIPDAALHSFPPIRNQQPRDNFAARQGWSMNDPDTSWRGVAITQANMIGIAMRAVIQRECTTCVRSPCSSPSFCRVCRRADRRAAKDHPQPEISVLCGAAPNIVVEALVYALRAGPKSIETADNITRLGRLSEPQLRDVYDRVQRFRADLEYEGVPAAQWSAEQARALIEKWIQHG
jgi:hypothetical protein